MRQAHNTDGPQMSLRLVLTCYKISVVLIAFSIFFSFQFCSVSICSVGFSIKLSQSRYKLQDFPMYLSAR